MEESFWNNRTFLSNNKHLLDNHSKISTNEIMQDNILNKNDNYNKKKYWKTKLRKRSQHKKDHKIIRKLIAQYNLNQLNDS